MRTEKTVLDVVSTLEGEKVNMSIDEGALAHIMSVLTDLYSDPEMAIIREYSTNAYDSHIEAGVTRPIEVDTPSPLSPYLKIRDFGVGLDADGIREIYSRYGASTKRESDDVVGMLGLGCKSALTYTDQFTLSGIKDGICTHVSISRDEDGSGSMTIVDTYQTDQPNGVEITIPAKKFNYLERKAQEFFRFWSEGTVLLNGEAPKRVGGFQVTDNILVSQEIERDTVVMGGVPYPLDHEYRQGGYYWVAFVDIGTVNFTPSRESLQMTAKTKATIETIRETVRAELPTAMENYIKEASSRLDALKRYHEAAALGYKGEALFNGEIVPAKIGVEMLDGNQTPPQFMVVKDRNRYYGTTPSWAYFIPTSQFNSTLWFTGFTDESFTPYKRKKLEQWLEKNNLSAQYYVLVDKLVSPEWIDQSTVHDWTEVAKEKVTRETKKRDGAISGSYPRVYDSITKFSEYNVLAKDIDTSQPLLYIATTDNLNQKVLNLAYPAGYRAVFMGKNRMKKFQRDFPMAVAHDDAINTFVQKWIDKLTDEHKIHLKYHDHLLYRNFSKLDIDSVDADDIKVVIAAAKNKKNDRILEEWNIVRYVHRGLDPVWLRGENVFDKYPLLTYMRGYGTIAQDAMNHIQLYINAVNAANPKENA